MSATVLGAGDGAGARWLPALKGPQVLVRQRPGIRALMGRLRGLGAPNPARRSSVAPEVKRHFVWL